VVFLSDEANTFGEREDIVDTDSKQKQIIYDDGSSVIVGDIDSLPALPWSPIALEGCASWQ
jgi:hypothetical protein